MNSLTRFSDRATGYTKHRPGYPQAAIDFILDEFTIKDKILAADIGAGTGISSILLANKGINVIAIEPNAAMRNASSSSVEFRDGTAESTNLPNASVDLVTSFQAFHWFNAESSLLEFKRILKPDGRLALVWNDLDLNDEFSASYKRLVRSVSDNSTPEQLWTAVKPLQESSLFTNFRSQSFFHKREFDLSKLIGLVKSISWFPNEAEVQQQIFSQLQNLCEYFGDENGLVYLIYRTSVHLAEVK